MTASTESPPRRLPDFFIVGHPKSGTTALWDMLKGHPQIYASAVKEPYFLADELRPPAATPRSFGWTPGTLEEYLSLFAGASPQQRAGEASAPYLWSRTAAGRIAELQPAARIIAILREPASFLHSLHLQFVQIYIEPEKDMRRAIALEDARREGKNLPENRFWGPHGTLYSEYVRYVEQLRRYRELFGAERMLVLIYEDFRADNEATVRQVLRFLEIDDTLPVETIEANPSVGFRAPRLNEHVRSLYLGDGSVAGALKAAVKALSTQRVRHAALGALGRRQAEPAPAPDAELMAELRERFRGEVQALGEYLDRDMIGFWGYGPS
jgi:Sulfotransferase domain